MKKNNDPMSVMDALLRLLSAGLISNLEAEGCQIWLLTFFGIRQTVQWAEIWPAWLSFKHTYSLPMNDPQNEEKIEVQGIPEWMAKNPRVFVIEQYGKLLCCLQAERPKKVPGLTRQVANQ